MTDYIPENHRCRSCKWYFENDEIEHKGVCKSGPGTSYPIQTMNAMQQPQMTIITVSPNKTSDDYCGQWESRKIAS